MSVKSWNVNWSGRSRSFRSRLRHVHVTDGGGADPGGLVLRANLSGFNEVPPVLTEGQGTFRARVRDDGQSIDYELTYSNLTTPAMAAHIHFGQPGVNGDIFVFLCGGGDKPSCPGAGGTVTGTITADDIMAIPEQGLEAGDLQGALRIIRAGVAYVNVHTPNFPGGEIRGQVRT